MLAMVRRLLHRASRGQGSCVLISGREGFGKSRLLDEAAAVCESAGTLFRLTFAPPWSTERRGLASIGTMERLQAMAVRRPVACLLDDLHRICPQDHHVFESLLRACATSRILVVATYRKDAGGIAPSIGTWLRAGALGMELPALDAASSELLLRAHAGPRFDRLRDDERSVVIATCGGNPRYIEEAGSELRAGTEADAVLPATARAKIAALRASLPQATVHVLRTASVIGDRFHKEWLSRLIDLSDQTLWDALQHAVDAAVIAEIPGSASEFAFEDCALRRGLYRLLIAGKRRQEHARVAEVLIDQRTDATNDVLIALQWCDAGNRENAVLWLRRAAAEEERCVRHANAVRLYERASELTDHGSPRWWEIEERLASCLAANFNFKGAALHRRGLAMHFAKSLRLEEAETQLMHLMHNYWYDGRFVEAEAIYRKLHRAQPPRYTTVRGELGWAELCLAAGQIERCRTLLESLSDDVLTTPDLLWKHRGLLAYCRASTQSFEVTNASFEAIFAEIVQAASPREAVFLAFRASNAAAELGYVATALEWTARAASLAQKHPDAGLGTAAFATLVECELHLLKGDIDAAYTTFSQFPGQSAPGALWDACVAGFGVFIGMRTGDPSLIAANFRPELLERAIRARHAEACAIALRGFAETMRARDLHDALTSGIRRCIDAELVDPFHAIQLVCAQYGDPGSLEPARRQIAHARTDATERVVAPTLALFDALVATRKNQPRLAREAARTAASGYGAAGWRWMEALALETAGDRTAASEIYERCGAVRDAMRVVGGARRQRKAAFGSALTPRENQIASLITSGLTNREIAARLRLSEHTVNHHVEAIFSKRGVRARWQLIGEMR